MLMHEPGNLLGVWYRSSNASDHEELVVPSIDKQKRENSFLLIVDVYFPLRIGIFYFDPSSDSFMDGYKNKIFF